MSIATSLPDPILHLISMYFASLRHDSANKEDAQTHALRCVSSTHKPMDLTQALLHWILLLQQGVRTPKLLENSNIEQREKHNDGSAGMQMQMQMQMLKALRRCEFLISAPPSSSSIPRGILPSADMALCKTMSVLQIEDRGRGVEKVEEEGQAEALVEENKEVEEEVEEEEEVECVDEVEEEECEEEDSDEWSDEDYEYESEDSDWDSEDDSDYEDDWEAEYGFSIPSAAPQAAAAAKRVSSAPVVGLPAPGKSLLDF